MAFAGGSDGSGAENLCVPGGAFRVMPSSEGLLPSTRMKAGNMRSPARVGNGWPCDFQFLRFQRVPPLVSTVVGLQGWQVPEVDLFVFHQGQWVHTQSSYERS